MGLDAASDGTLDVPVDAAPDTVPDLPLDGPPDAPDAQPDLAPDACVDCPVAVDRVEPAVGPIAGGTRITLHGQRFGDGLTVTLALQPCADIVVRDPTTATCLTPPGDEATRVVDVRVEQGRRGATLENGYRYLLPPFSDLTARLGDGAAVFPDGMGVTLEDFDGDGQIDIHFSRTTSVDARELGLLSGQPGLRFVDRQAQLGYAGLPLQEGISVADFDGDGRRDGVVVYRWSEATAQGSNIGFLRGTQGGRVDPPVPVELIAIDDRHPQSFQLFSIDDDGDGDLDLLGCSLLGRAGDPHDTLVRLENRAGVLTEVPVEQIPEADAVPVWCSGIALGDYDTDGDVDVAYCYDALRVFRNDAGRFTEVTRALGLDARFDDLCNTVQWVDVDVDGRLDLTWGMVARRDQVLGSATFVARNDGARFVPWVATDDLLPDVEECVGEFAGRTLRYGATNRVWLDVDHDGDPDLFAPTPYPFSRCVDAPVLLRSAVAQGEAHFTPEVVPIAPILGVLYSNTTTGLATADLDADGDLDVVAHNWGEGRRLLLRNNLAENDGADSSVPARYLVIEPITDPDGDATDGDRTDDRRAPFVTILVDLDSPEDPDFAPGPGRLRARGHAQGYQSQGPTTAHFGLGDRQDPLWVRVYFPDGSQTTQRVADFDTTLQVRDCAADCTR